MMCPNVLHRELLAINRQTHVSKIRCYATKARGRLTIENAGEYLESEVQSDYYRSMYLVSV